MGQSAQLLEGERRGFRNVLSVLSVLSAGPVTKRAELTNLRRCFLDVGNHLSWPLGRHRFHMPQVFISSPEDTAGPRTPELAGALLRDWSQAICKQAIHKKARPIINSPYKLRV